MKKITALILSMLLVASCFALVAFAEEETTEEAVSYSNTLLVFNEDNQAMRILSDPNGINKTYFQSEWEGARLKLTDVADPHITINWTAYIKKAGLEMVDSQDYPFVAFKLKVEGYIDDIELFYCAGDIVGPTAGFSTTTDYPCVSSGEVEYIIYDLTGDCQGNYNLFRIDPMGADEDTVIYLYEFALFATEQEAIAYTGFMQEETETTVHETVAPETIAPETETEADVWETEEIVTEYLPTIPDIWETEEIVTEYPSTIPDVWETEEVMPETEDPKDLLGDYMDFSFDGFHGIIPTMLGCNSAIGVSVSAFLFMIALGALCFKKKD